MGWATERWHRLNEETRAMLWIAGTSLAGVLAGVALLYLLV